MKRKHKDKTSRTFVKLRDLLDKDDDTGKGLDPVVLGLAGVGHLDGEDVFLVQVVVDGL